jgi:acetyl-CoA acetyltransferase
MTIRDKYAFAGVGVTRQGRMPELSEEELAVQAVRLAIEDAGLKKSDINGYICERSYGSGFTPQIVRDLGIPARLIWQFYATGTHGAGIFLASIGALESGVCDTVVLVYSSSASTRKVQVGVNSEQSLEGAYGLYGPAAMVAGWARRYMHLYGVTERHLGMVAVTLREYANQRPEAMMYGQKLSLEDYFNSRYVAEPLRARDCCLVNDGAAALIITTAERAKSLRQPPVYIMGYAQDYSAGTAGRDPERVYQFDGSMTSGVGETALRMAGIELKDIDIAQFYDAFTVNLVAQLSSYGFCRRGEEGAFIEEGNIKPGGVLPCNTSGTELSWGYMHSWTHFVEAVRQLRGQAGAGQIKGAEICLVTGGLRAMESGIGSTCFLLRR